MTDFPFGRALLSLVLLSVPGWSQTALGLFEGSLDIGDTPKTGAAELKQGEYAVTGGGANIWAAQDAFHFLWKKVSGDFRLSADVRFIGEGTVAHRKAVLMFRQSLTPGSAYADIALHGDGLTSLQYRPVADAPTAEQRSNLSAPTHLVIERRGKQFTIRANKPGQEEAVTGPQTVELADPFYAGIGVCSHDANILETAIFSNVKLEPIAPQPRYRSKVHIFDLKTKQSKEIYQAEGVIEAPNWSRDGSFLLINTNGNLYKLPVGGASGPLEQIQFGAAGYRCNNDHDLSRDGKRLAFSASSPESRQSHVYISNADGSGAQRMTETAPSYFHGWSPDGKWIAIVGQRNGKYELFRIPSAGGPEQRLTSKGAYDDGPEYTPDGKWIYFNSNRSGGWDIWRMPADGAGEGDAQAQPVTSDEWEDWFPHFSPNGKWMLFLSFPKGTAGHNDRMEGMALRIAKAPGKKPAAGKIETLTTFFGGQGTINVNSWSPDSTRFAYVVFEKLP